MMRSGQLARKVCAASVPLVVLIHGANGAPAPTLDELSEQYGKLLSAWQDCILGFSAQAARGNPEAASVIADTAMVVCIPAENAAYAAASRLSGPVATAREDMLPSLWRTMHGNLRQKAVGAVMLMRSNGR